jgi:hypothetical protein
MRSCTVTEKLEIVQGSAEDYKRLAHFHYRDSRLSRFTKIFAIRPLRALAGRFGTKTVGVIVYSMPSPGAELRNAATANFFIGLERRTQLSLIDKNIRCIRRVIIEPRLRGLGLASRLVRDTMPKMNVPMIEAMAVMGHVNPFFERAGMKAYTAKMPARCVRLIEAFSVVGIEKEQLIDADAVRQKLDRLEVRQRDFIEREITKFLQSYGQNRYMPAGVERTRFALSKLTHRPIYYIWFNPDLALVTG